MTLRHLLVFGPLLALAGACGGATAEAPEAAEPAIDRGEALGQARGVVTEVYALVRRGDRDGLQTLLGSELVAVGPRAADVFTTRTDALVALEPAMKRGQKKKLQSKGLIVAPGPSGTSAWAVDLVELDGRRFSVGVVLEAADELWTATVVQVGAAAGEKPPTIPAGGVAPAAREVVPLAVAAAEDRKVLAEQWIDGQAAVFLGSGKTAQRGGKKLKKAFGGKKPPKGLPAGGVLGEELRAGLSGDGELCWILGVVTSDDAPPRRWLLVYVKAEDGWRLAALHVAAAS